MEWNRMNVCIIWILSTFWLIAWLSIFDVFLCFTIGIEGDKDAREREKLCSLRCHKTYIHFNIVVTKNPSYIDIVIVFLSSSSIHMIFSSSKKGRIAFNRNFLKTINERINEIVEMNISSFAYFLFINKPPLLMILFYI